ncbi:cytochrome P450 [Methylobacterium sp. WL30]|uniref:cytochrome P450 n=1 Tax=unclassified Methylobacterium TaxID=2615210 RepID=UPI0011C8922F|nr:MULTISPECIES: cytochrome P450 [unclassified Methylobacterium]TXN41220.1 cytochrome P450 [Methylobacterium sp. WL93]TXN50632.1 cytochrome P450 [Methylobacterium sp. WL119]TXN68247.1 cytochrome P450 [Methylobacterium sp. WL30]TXN70165.1 cytochrome P450 [Methylobacterium sp. WL6]
MSNVRHPRSPLLGIRHLWRIRRDQLRFYADMRQSYGDTVRLRLGPYRSWLLFHPREIETVLVGRAPAFIRFRKLTRVIAQWNGDSLIVEEGARWRDRRRKVQPAFQTRRVKEYARTGADHAARLCARFDAAITAGSLTVDTDAVMARLTLDIATGTLFGAEPLSNGDAVERAIQILSETAFRETTAPLVLPDWLPLPAKARKRWAMGLMDDVVTGLAQGRIEGRGEDRGDLLAMLVQQHDGRLKSIRDDAMSLLIAGHETSGALLSWLFLALVEHPGWRKRAVDEVSTALAGRPAGIDDLPQLPILRAIIAEVLRLWPPAYSLFLRQATEEVVLGDNIIAPGDLVQIVPYTLHRDPRWFADPDRFDPERFLKAPSWPTYAYLPFGSGPRICIGQNFALVEACVVAATILGRWEPVAVPHTPRPDPKFSLRPTGGLPMTWQPVRITRA